MSSDLFDFAHQNHSENDLKSIDSVFPLAHRMRPRSLGQLFGQNQVLGRGKPLHRWIELDQVPSLIFWGPPGCGKTTLAKVIARQTRAEFKSISAVLSGVKDIKESVARAKFQNEVHQKRSILFIDEIHRFNKNQQDALLPHVENGTITLIGATTENPSFEINSALLSRVKVIRLEALDELALIQILNQAIADPQRGLKNKVELSKEAIQFIAKISSGDARKALTTLDNVTRTPISLQLKETLDLEKVKKSIKDSIGDQPILYDKNGEEHYNVISAFIKSIRGSDPDAAIYYLARMIVAGEDPKFIARRLVILASEDIGNADPRALMIATATLQAIQFVGMPEGRINLAQAVTYMACAPKSNASYSAIDSAIAEVKDSGALRVPMHLRNAVTSLMKDHGYGKGYEYAHNQKNQKVSHSHLPKEIEAKKYYFPKNSGFETGINAGASRNHLNTGEKNLE